MKKLLCTLVLLFIGISFAVAGLINQVEPGIGIGPIKLGMPCDQINKDALNFSIEYECFNNKLLRVSTNTGGSVYLKNKTIGAFDLMTMLEVMGGSKPDEVGFETEYELSKAFWFSYFKEGIAFRMVCSKKDQVCGLQRMEVFAPK
jgi:hypothetical protein